MYYIDKQVDAYPGEDGFKYTFGACIPLANEPTDGEYDEAPKSADGPPPVSGVAGRRAGRHPFTYLQKQHRPQTWYSLSVQSGLPRMEHKKSKLW